VKFFQHTLSNGLSLIGEQRETAVSSAIGFFVRTGARDETDEVSGVSHFLEHMMFKGTAKRSALDITYQMGAIGAQANAYTSEETTVYYMAVLPEYFDTALELLSDMLRPSLDKAEFDVEKNVILEEIALYHDRPTHILFESAMKTFFGSHPAGNSVLGTIESITALSREQMQSYFDSRYAPNNLVLCATGDFDWDSFVEQAERYCGSWKREDCPRELLTHSPEKVDKIITKADLTRAHLCLVGPGPSAQDPLRYSAQVLSTILGDSSGSRAYWELVDKGLADAASIDIDDMDGTGMTYGYVSSDPERIDEVGDVIRSIMCSPKPFTAEALERAKTKLRTRLVLQGESSMRRLMAVGNDWLYRQSYSTLDEESQRFQEVNAASIDDCLNTFSFEPTASVKLLPE
jgi:predicted Zn-dependent peptidase